MLTFNNSEAIVEDTIGILKNKYKNKQLFMELLDKITIWFNKIFNSKYDNYNIQM